MRLCFIIHSQSIPLVAFKKGDVEPFWVQLVDINEQFPCPIDGLLLEVIAKAPIPQHLKQGVMVGVNSNLFQVIMLA